MLIPKFIAGSLFAHFQSFIDPSSFVLSQLVLFLTIVIVGGIASIKGSIVATVLILGVPEMLRFVALSPSILGPAREILYALVLLGILLFRPRGIFGRVDLQ